MIGEHLTELCTDYIASTKQSNDEEIRCYVADFDFHENNQGSLPPELKSRGHGTTNNS